MPIGLSGRSVRGGAPAPIGDAAPAITAADAPWLSTPMRGVLAGACAAIARRPGAFVILGEPGIGKTQCARALAAALEAAGHVVWRAPSTAALQRLAARAAAADRDGAALVLLWDDAERLDRDSLHALARLLRSAAASRVRAILIGQPALEAALRTRGLAALRRRVRWQARLAPLAESDLPAFVEGVLGGASALAPHVARELMRHTGGHPGRVAALWTQARALAQAAGAPRPARLDVEQAARLQRRQGAPAAEPVAPPHAPRWRAAAAAALAAALLPWLAPPLREPNNPRPLMLADASLAPLTEPRRINRARATQPDDLRGIRPPAPLIARAVPAPAAGPGMTPRETASLAARPAQPRCEPYVAAIDVVGRPAPRQGLACRDAAGQWRLTTQQME